MDAWHSLLLYLYCRSQSSILILKKKVTQAFLMISLKVNVPLCPLPYAEARQGQRMAAAAAAQRSLT